MRGERGGSTGRERTANAVWPGDGGTGRGTDSGQQPASQRPGGADERSAARPAGQGAATGEDQRPGKRQPVSGRNVSTGVQPAVCAKGGQPAGRASRPAP